METIDQETVIAKARPIKLLALDVDGVMTDGQLYFAQDGSELKTFNTLDGHGIKMLQRCGIEVAIITGRTSTMVANRARALGVVHLYQGREDKRQALTELAAQLELEWQQIAYCGDDLPDLGAIRQAGLGLSVANAPDYIRAQADYCTQRPGGQGAVREICDLILQAQGHWQSLFSSFC